MPQTAPVMSLPISMIILQLIMSTMSLMYFSNHTNVVCTIDTANTTNNMYWLW